MISGCRHSAHQARLVIRRGLPAMALCALVLLLAACAANLSPGTSPQEIATAPQAGAGASPSSGPNRGQRGQKVKIALLLPLSGISQTAIVAKSMKQAAELALFENDNPNIQLIVKNDGGSPDGARKAAEEAITEGAEIILGPLFAKSVTAAADVGRRAVPPVPVLAFSNDRSVAGNGAYLISFLPEPEVQRIVDYAVRQGKRRMAALIPDNTYGHRVEAAFQSAVSRHGAVVFASERYPVQTNGMLEPVQKLLETIKPTDDMGAPVDALFLPGGPEVLPAVGPLIKYAGIDTKQMQLLGTGAWDFPNLGRDKIFVGGWYASPEPGGFKAFSERFARTFGQAPPRVATLSYDAMNIAIELSKAQPGQRFTPDRLTRPTGFRGTEGPLRLRSDGTTERTLAVLEVQRFGTRTVETRPQPGTGAAAIAPFAPRAPSAYGLETGSTASRPFIGTNERSTAPVGSMPASMATQSAPF